MNYFNALPFREALIQLGTCRFMDRSELQDGTAALRGKKIVIVGCGAQGLNQGLNLRDSGTRRKLCPAQGGHRRQAPLLAQRHRKRLQGGHLRGTHPHRRPGRQSDPGQAAHSGHQAPSCP
jgi:hypothetical protein